MFQLHHIDIRITDVEKSIWFYESLGFKKVQEYELSDKKIILMDFNGIYLEMKYDYLNDCFTEAKDNKVFGLSVDNIDEAKKHLESSKLVKEKIEIKTGILNKKYFIIHDPNNILIEFIEK